MVNKITEKEFSELDKSGIGVVDFSATWCGPCKMVAPVLEELSGEMENVKFYNIDVDENPNIASTYKITNIPAIMIMKDGQKQEMMVGFQPKENFRTAIEKYL